MLRISYSQTEARPRWTLCGQLAGPWVEELRSLWQDAGKGMAGSPSVVDLSDVTFIDEAGERLLSEMRSARVEFVAAGVDTKDLIKNLMGKGERPLRRLIGHLPGWANPCGEPRLTKDSTKERDK
jgi:hypothetical protein